LFVTIKVLAAWQVALAGGTFEPELPEHVVKVRSPIANTACKTVRKEIMVSSGSTVYRHLFVRQGDLHTNMLCQQQSGQQ
jgi:hypothetical protein